MVYEVTEAAFENFEDFKTLHPTVETQALSAPLHAVAEEHYQESGMM